MSEARKVVIYKWVKVVDKPQYEKEAIGHGIFHQFGVDYEEFESGPGNFSTAIVEMPSGEIKNIPVDLVVFNN